MSDNAQRAPCTVAPLVLQVIEAGWFRFEPDQQMPVPAAAQMINGEWWCPRFGCDSLEASMDALETMMRNAAVSGAAVRRTLDGPVGDRDYCLICRREIMTESGHVCTSCANDQAERQP